MAEKICPDCKALNMSSALYCVVCGSSLKNARLSEPGLQSPSRSTSSQTPSAAVVPTPSASAGAGITYKTYAGTSDVVIVDFNMPFVSMVTFLVKLALAAIPAAIILSVIYIAIMAVFGGIFTAILRSF